MKRFMQVMGRLLGVGAAISLTFMFSYWWAYEYGGHHTVEYRTVTIVDDNSNTKECVVFTYGRGMAADCDKD